MKKIITLFSLVLFNICLFAQQAPPKPTKKQSIAMQKRAQTSAENLLKKEGEMQYKHFAVNNSTANTIMYVEFLSKKGNRYTIPCLFVSWTLSEDGKEGAIEVYKDSLEEDYPVLSFSISERPYFYTQAKSRQELSSK